MEDVRLSVTEKDGVYSVNIGAGSSVTETAFCMGVIVRCFLKDNYIKDPYEFLNKVLFYATDDQFIEKDSITEDTNENQEIVEG